MAKSLRSKRKKRLRTLRREIVEPFYDQKDAAKLAAQEAALAAPKLPVRYRSAAADNDMDSTTAPLNLMDVEMADGGTSSSLKPMGGVGKKTMKKKNKFKKGKRHGKGRGRTKRT